jgi:hypothetical protein
MRNILLFAAAIAGAGVVMAQMADRMTPASAHANLARKEATVGAAAGLVALLGPWRQPTLGWSLVVTGGAPLIAALFLLYSVRGGARDPAMQALPVDGATATVTIQ